MGKNTTRANSVSTNATYYINQKNGVQVGNGYISSKWEGYERSNDWTSSLTANYKFCYLHVGLRTGPQTGVPGTLKCLVVEEENSKKEEETIFQESPRSTKTGTETNIFGIRQNLIN